MEYYNNYPRAIPIMLRQENKNLCHPFLKKVSRIKTLNGQFILHYG